MAENNVSAIAIEALEQLRKPDGAYSRDTEQYLINVIENSITIASAALEEIHNLTRDQ